ncbi:thiamine pyrophosphate-dependent dehydrogenase E1 component subunit alpha [Candidatus Nitronereus thalassa]|uniref:Thiamine pyrophosphate-dependent dehydrogenase E1 component subunit alpha n=1 Tax=Candidatus Nitronereus thalassa TaxID=3020898 RepID=A0ABU3K5I7_9BACT|nr:thiamine pyrophosphate-dependent dehydrogenase E1 component subunit alpha [Candidatus Nitronereus thalassa]MDT7041674.1 thiamine pyrophosphate-dependent dehydrogenase E1 component subunit alpha [Candidatus Nitronereus thalassa]
MYKDEALKLYRKLYLTRRAEEKIGEEYFKDGMKTPVHLGIGGEAIPIGVCHSLPIGFKAFGTYRNHTLYLTMTEDTDGFFAELYGKVTGSGKGKAGSMHLCAPENGLVATSAVVASTIPVAVGVALANAYRGSKDFVVVFFGDGAVEEGTFWESLNFACLKQLRVLFVCEDNDLAIHTPASERQGFRTILDAIGGFKCYSDEADGHNLLEVISATSQMVKKMLEHPRPGFIRFPYLRFLEHVGPREDFNTGYRPKPDQSEMNRLDPLLAYEQSLLNMGCSEKDLLSVQAEVRKQIDRSVKMAESAPFPDASELYQDVLI